MTISSTRTAASLGFLVEAKYTDITATLTASLAGVADVEFAHARGPIPAIGIIGRGYVVPNISITGEFSGFPEVGTAGSSRYGGKYYDLDIYGTVNFNDHIGAQVGYRSFDVTYKVNLDNGTMKLKGLYFGGVAQVLAHHHEHAEQPRSRGCSDPPPTAGSRRRRGCEAARLPDRLRSAPRSGAPRRASARSPRDGRRCRA